MKEFTLSNIDTSFSCYNRFAALYDDLSFTNEISVKTENPGILSVLRRNNFLANYGLIRELQRYPVDCPERACHDYIVGRLFHAVIVSLNLCNLLMYAMIEIIVVTGIDKEKGEKIWQSQKSMTKSTVC